ncbi:pentapeptide repeat-containing protein [Actinacidiphila yanglinensis]|uniref:pentapeptide repeat-containing protein n=1 Tax=Actinacidiphila yanglinensis TaxID=310779 RepID=UPI000CDEBD84
MLINGGTAPCRGAILRGADLHEADLTGAILHSVRIGRPEPDPVAHTTGPRRRCGCLWGPSRSARAYPTSLLSRLSRCVQLLAPCCRLSGRARRCCRAQLTGGSSSPPACRTGQSRINVACGRPASSPTRPSAPDRVGSSPQCGPRIASRVTFVADGWCEPCLPGHSGRRGGVDRSRALRIWKGM